MIPHMAADVTSICDGFSVKSYTRPFNVSWGTFALILESVRDGHDP